MYNSKDKRHKTERIVGRKMGYFIFIAGALLFLIIKSAYDAKEREKRLVNRIRDEWGDVPGEEYISDKFNSLKKYYESIKEPDKDVDDITYNDLDIKQIYMIMNNTGSAIGEEYLYALLRKPIYDQEELDKRNDLIHYFTKHADERLKVQTVLAKMGKLKSISIFEYINRTDNIQAESNGIHYFMAFGLIFSLCLIFFQPTLGIIGTLVFLSTNVISYFKFKAKIEGYFTVFSYILRMLDSARNIRKLDLPELKPYTDQLGQAEKVFKKFRKGSYIVVGGRNMSGDLMDITLDYVRMLFHGDIIKFSTMLKIVRENRGILNQMFVVIGLLDSMIAAASFRKMQGIFCEPVLSSEKKPFFKVNGLYHPLLDEPVVNSIHEERSVLITGSNASGKSTFIKTAALNCILSQTIYTSLSISYEASFFRVFSSMALRDDIASHESYYIVEIKSLKRILDKVNGEIPVLCFVDEVLRGTNTLERIAASSQILKSLAEGNALCFAATHDIELTHILEKIYSNYHFTEQVRDDKILFDYKLNEGRAVTKNAIKLLGIMGYTEEIIDNANEAANSFLEKGSWDALL